MPDYTAQIRNCIETSAIVLAQYDRNADPEIMIACAEETAKAVNERAKHDPELAVFLAETFGPRQLRTVQLLIALAAFSEQRRKEGDSIV